MVIARHPRAWLSILAPALAAAGCTGQEPAPPEAQASSSPAPSSAGQAASGGDAAAQPTAIPTAPPPATRAERSRFTSLKNCPVRREERAEMPLTEVECSGPDGWRLRITDVDARQFMVLRGPAGGETRLALSHVDKGAFSSFDDVAEWRAGAGAAPDAPPRALIVRYRFAREPYPAPETSVLLVVRLEPTPCLAGVIEAGPRQNETARALADRADGCSSDHVAG